MHFFLRKPFARTRIDIDKPPYRVKAPYNGEVVVMSESPETIGLQIRTAGRLTDSRNGKCRPCFSHVSLTAEDIDKVVAALKEAKRHLVKP